MQFTRHGIPVNVPQGFNPRKKVKVVKQQKEKVYKHYAELKRNVDGLEQSIITPVEIAGYQDSLLQGYKVVSQWSIN